MTNEVVLWHCIQTRRAGFQKEAARQKISAEVYYAEDQRGKRNHLDSLLRPVYKSDVLQP